MKELNIIQTRLNAPKKQYNSFGKYSYRSCEDILEALKPLLAETGCTLTISDEIVQVGERYYVKATATLKNGEGEIVTNTAFAREPDKKTGMDEAQVTGATSSYCRKYCLNGLFCIDDNKDPDFLNTGDNPTAPATTPATTKPTRGRGNKAQAQPVQQPTPQAPENPHFDNTVDFAIQQVSLVGSSEQLMSIWNQYREQFGRDARFVKAIQASPYHPNNAKK